MCGQGGVWANQLRPGPAPAQFALQSGTMLVRSAQLPYPQRQVKRERARLIDGSLLHHLAPSRVAALILMRDMGSWRVAVTSHSIGALHLLIVASTIDGPEVAITATPWGMLCCIVLRCGPRLSFSRIIIIIIIIIGSKVVWAINCEDTTSTDSQSTRAARSHFDLSKRRMAFSTRQTH